MALPSRSIRALLTSSVRNINGCISRTYYLYSSEPFHPYPERQPKWMSAEEAVSVIKSGHKVFLHAGAATPTTLADAMAVYGKKAGLRNVEVLHLHSEGPATYAQPEYKDHFRSNSFFIGANVRKAINSGDADVIPIFLSEIPLLFHCRLIHIDVALVSVSPPDKHGYCSLGVSVDCARAAMQNAKYIIGLVNKQMPRTFGDGLIHQCHFDAMVAEDRPLPELQKSTASPQEEQIGKLIAENLVQDGATLQMGIGSIPNAVLDKLGSHRDLGIHTEMFSDGVVDLVETGAVSNTKKIIQPGKILSSFTIGTKKLYDFLDNNPSVVMVDAAYSNSTDIISQNPKVTAINSAIEVDLTGQVVSDSIGTRMYSGFGGQVDFIRGASLCRDGLGKPIIALPSQTKRGETKIVPLIKEGAGVVTTRAHVHYVVTEFGIAFLFGKSLRQRAYELIKIAHPNHREQLEKAAFDRLKCMPAP
ncbi:4-hydroxybutyrate coenzyme A transferase-like [Haliotis rufescens]|uniref:4-hydroxybutyrate coenzyme A transferase-like n=1 Tax=Haliotis rufescens TaxID=6454 RepID=UPI00201EF320|nr:4-hydroxybutyrate coenzyme A transferase-like [Haliotis rufescens]